MRALANSMVPVLVAGVDEVGRGPLAGPVVAAAVVLEADQSTTGIRDSKQLTARRRDELACELRHCCRDWAIAWADPAEIDSLNILGASMLAMRRAVQGLRVRPSRVRVDGNQRPSLRGGGAEIDIETIVGGDRTVPAISAASILAKVWRDRLMIDLDKLYPVYGFTRNKGYPTTEHRAALRIFGPCPIHRRSFRPVRESLLAAA